MASASNKMCFEGIPPVNSLSKILEKKITLVVASYLEVVLEPG
jgi:hypothetical protein